ncbi:uncharacterized protein BKA55DRAFT_536099 [Fusarium redolens]|uniref:Uncharacterized protein n=1 Tax=Fusarium redolens TaxID=48865 RepID=A0A9P9HQ29_FUSRE|nr:uncharacterized protein BKA55DRAFT_536099 [Fusarium redolens]KAH7261092.1 hypothetical protein BKA55DRAFT_536099 [Fusarium redolens]
MSATYELDDDGFPPAEVLITMSEDEDPVLRKFKEFRAIAQRWVKSDQQQPEEEQQEQQSERQSNGSSSTATTFLGLLTPPSTPPPSTSNPSLPPSQPSDTTPDDGGGNCVALLVETKEVEEQEQDTTKTTSPVTHHSESHSRNSFLISIQPHEGTAGFSSANKTTLLSLGSGDARWGVLRAIVHNQVRRARQPSPE